MRLAAPKHIKHLRGIMGGEFRRSGRSNDCWDAKLGHKEYHANGVCYAYDLGAYVLVGDSCWVGYVWVPERIAELVDEDKLVFSEKCGDQSVSWFRGVGVTDTVGGRAYGCCLFYYAVYSGEEIDNSVPTIDRVLEMTRVLYKKIMDQVKVTEVV